MKISSVICLLILLSGLSPVLTASENGTKVSITLPPASLEQWYKPANKRQVWLHTMFRLRRNMQAVTMYANNGDRNKLQKWVNRLVKDYTSIGEMVPEWDEKLDKTALQDLVAAADSMDMTSLARKQHKLKKSCRGCHSDFRAITALLHRGPDFSEVNLLDEEGLQEVSMGEAMEDLSTSLNQIVISLDDDRPQDALMASKRLNQQLMKLAGTCVSCHQDESARKNILGAGLDADMAHLTDLVEARQKKESMRAVGHVAVNVCARCHGIHRTMQDLREFIESDPGDREETAAAK